MHIKAPPLRSAALDDRVYGEINPGCAKEVDRIGGREPLKVDFRLIAATNKDLGQMAAAGKYREDLYYRLCADLVRTPALRDRLEDIRELGLYFALRCERPATRALKGISQEVLDLFQSYPWPGNVREFQDVVQWAVRTSADAMLKMEDLPEWFLERVVPSSLAIQNHDEIVEQTSRRLCVSALAATQGNYSKAAKLLKLNRTTFYRLAKRHGIGDSSNN